MKRVPHASQAGRALTVATKAVNRSLGALNQAAGQLMAKGDYAGAEALAAKGCQLQQFCAEVEGLGKRWRMLRNVIGDSSVKQVTTPLWSFYQPVLKALSALGGEGRIEGLEPQVEQIMSAVLQPGDRIKTGQRERWKVMIRRTRKPLIAEGWIDDVPGTTWRITDLGRRAAEKPLMASAEHVK